LGCAFLVRDLRALARIRRSAVPVAADHGTALDVLARVRARLGVEPPIDLRISGAIGAPGVVGWRRPAILLPQGAVEVLGAGELEALLAHEVGHAMSPDHAVGVAQLLFERALVFNPFARLLSGWCTEEREALRDRCAVGVVPPTVYAGMLLTVEGLRATRLGRSPIVPLRPGTRLLDRVRRLMPGGARRPVRRSLCAAYALASVLLALALAQGTIGATAIGSWAVMDLDVAARTARTQDPAGPGHD
jgi:beta-lactamase regulating signal transducer with metallopeptidase domain